uniref:uncharacterized protein LOC120342363 n=1 Tax=Styela clava TaxID=7725 RepID=UPI00193A4F64|nr:uncharacterized protein LOC120342363 [Styela clava]
MLAPLILLLSSAGFTHSALHKTVYAGGYKLSYWAGGEDYASWCKSRELCTAHDSFLAMPKTATLETAIEEIVPTNGYTWIGATDAVAEDYYRWSDGTAVDDYYTDWQPGQPDQFTNYEDCLEIRYYSSLAWNDRACESRNGHVCQQSQSKEVASQNSVLTFSDASGNLDSRATFLEARKACENNGMRLARVDEKKEYETLKQKLRGNPEVKYWIETEFADCVYMSYINSLKASDCMDLKLPFICEEISPWAVTLSSESAELQEEENLKIDCTAKGFPLPVVSWYKDEELLTNDSNERVHQSIESASSTLVINNSHLTDAGRYRCFATNAAINFELNVLAFVDLKVNPKGVEFQKVEEKTPDFFAEVQKLKEK